MSDPKKQTVRKKPPGRFFRPRFSLRFLILVTTLIAVGTFVALNVRVLRLNGVYQSSKSPRGYFYELRFDDEGNVRTKTSSTAATQIGPDAFDAPIYATRFNGGHYDLEGREIRFRSFSNSGSVDYDGLVGWDSIELFSHSNINGHEQTRTFRFVTTEPEARWKIIWPWTKVQLPEDEETIDDPAESFSPGPSFM